MPMMALGMRGLRYMSHLRNTGGKSVHGRSCFGRGPLKGIGTVHSDLTRISRL